MESKTVLKNLIEQTVQGNFDHVYNYISSLHKPLEENIAIKFIIACCNACNNNLSTPNNLNEGHLVLLVKCLLSFIKTPLREHCDSYLQSVFYILRLLVEKKSFGCILQLEELLMPAFMPLIFTEKQTATHQNICKVLYNAIVRISNSKEKTYRSDVLKLSFLLCSLYKKSHNANKLLECLHNCIISLANLNVDAQELLKFYNHCLSLLDERDVSIYHLLINSFSCLYAHLLKMEKFEIAESCYNCTVAKIKQIFKGKEHAILGEILAFVKWINPMCDNNSTEIPTKAHNTLKNYYKQCKSMTNLQSICDVISSVSFVIAQYYKTNSSKWLEMSPEVHLEAYKFLHDVSHIMSKTPHECSCKCSTKTNLNEALRTLDSVSGFGRLFISKTPTTPRNYKMDLLRYIEKYTEHIAALKHNGCSKWRNYWYSAGVHLYSIGLRLQEQKDFELCALYMKKFTEVLLTLEGVNSEIIEKTYLISALGVIADCWLELKDYEKCLLIIAYAMTIGSGKDLINRWIRTKVACRDNTIEENDAIQELTVVSVYQKHKSELAVYFSNNSFEVGKKKQVELLVNELNNYRMKWKSKVPMMAAYRHLSQIADSVTSAKVFIEVWGDCDLKVHDNIPKLLQNTIKRLEIDTMKERSVQVKFYLSYLYFLQHKYRVNHTIIKHCDEMERTLNMFKMATEVGPVPPDPNEECDIVSSYDCLKITKYLQMIRELNKSLDMIVELFQSIDQLSERDKLYKLLIQIGHEYSLHVFAAKSLQAFELALRLAKLENNNVNILQAATFLIELTDVRKPSVQKLVREVEDIVTAFLSKKSKLEEITVYFLSKSEAYFLVDFDTAYHAFRQVIILCQSIEESNILKARIHRLHHKFITLPCEFNVEGHEEYSTVRIHQAYNQAIVHYTENISDSAYYTRIFFEICEELVKMYHDLRLPREVRCYGKEVVIIAQKMVLPLRTTSLLYYLAIADLNSARLDDCRVKVEGVGDILCLAKCKMSMKSLLSAMGNDKLDELMDNLATELGEIMLDVPVKNSKPTSLGSPIFDTESFQMPLFLKHEESCECFYCIWVEYHQYVLRKTYLHALFYEHDGNLSHAKDFYCGSIKIFECFKSKRDDYLRKMTKKMSEELVPLPQDRFSEIYCTILLGYGDFFLRSGKVKEAENLNNKIMEKIEGFKLQCLHLYNEVLVQKLNIYGKKYFVKENNKSELVPEDLNKAMIIKTPETKQSKVVVSPVYSPGYVDKVKVLPKSLKFDLSDEEEISETKKVTKNVPSFLNAAKTPAPSSSKIKIYTNAKCEKKKKVLDEVPSSKSARALDFLVPASPEAYTPSSVKRAGKVDLNLDNRTKLLTEKLRSSNRKCNKVPSIMVSDENGDEGCSSNAETRRARVRQNLLKQLEGTENAEQGGAVRRSERRKK